MEVGEREGIRKLTSSSISLRILRFLVAKKSSRGFCSSLCTALAKAWVMARESHTG